jgi:acetylornithine deacetylase/succinyl-diaminopimelate desuccinylase-like protein
VGVKQSSKVTLRVRGRAGDASLPGVGRDAVRPLAELVARIPHFVGEPVIGFEAESILAAAAPGNGSVGERLTRVREADGYLGQIVEALMRTTAVPVQLSANGPFNVVSDGAECLIQCSLPPETTQEQLVRQLRAAVGDGDYELDASEPLGGLRSPPDSPLRDAIEGFLGEHDPDARLVPTLGYGYSDCHVLRETFGTTTYGFIPFRHAPPAQNLETKHGPDERVLVDDLDFQVRCALHVATTLGA